MQNRKDIFFVAVLIEVMMTKYLLKARMDFGGQGS